MITIGNKKERRLHTKLGKEMMEKVILAKLYNDGIFVVDEKEKKVVVDSRLSTLTKYGEKSYTDIKSIIDRTVAGLKLAGYSVSVKVLEVVEG
jgi:hypothetical protein